MRFLAIAVIICSLLSVGCFQEEPNGEKPDYDAQIPEDVLEAAKNATVRIIATEADNSDKNGSGFFVKRDKIVTNIHVVAGARTISVVRRKKVYNVEKVAGYDPEHDLVILKVSGESEPLELGEGKKDEPILAVGDPSGGDYEEKTGKIHSI